MRSSFTNCFTNHRLPVSKHFELGFHTQIAQDRGAFAQVIRCRDVRAVTVTEVELPQSSVAMSACICLRAQVDDMRIRLLAAEVTPGCGSVRQPLSPTTM